jgi:protein TonB
MFDTLLESATTHERYTTGQIVAVVLHLLAIGGGVLATRDVVRATQPPDEHTRPVFVAAPPAPPAPALPRASSSAAPATPAVRPIPILVAPIDIPNMLPPIDLMQAITNDADYARGTRPIAPAAPTGGQLTGSVDASATYLGSQVEKPAAQISGTGVPDYPHALREAGIEGRVRVRFVVDTTGRALMSTLEITEASRPEFASAVRRALPQMRFLAAETGGRRVRQWVELPFTFSVR